jgi:GNAT superfamily N-acetyltransferase
LAEPPGDDWHIERLARSHDRTGFDCGILVLSEWLKQRAGQYDKRDLSRTYVAARRGESIVLGYYAISSHRVSHEALPVEQSKGLPHLDLPVVLLGRLAVDRSVQGKGLGALLLVDALRRAEFLAEHVGIRTVEVDAIDNAARGFYLKFGFTALLDDPRHLFLPIAAARKLALPRRGR